MIAKGQVIHEDPAKKIVFVRVWKDLDLATLDPFDIHPELNEPWAKYDGDCTLIIRARRAEIIGIMHVPDRALWKLRNDLADEFGFDSVWGDRWEKEIVPKTAENPRGYIWRKRFVEMKITRGLTTAGIPQREGLPHS